MDIKNLLLRIRHHLEKVHCDRLKGVVLYGSFARGAAATDSDVDVLVLLDDVSDYGEDLRKNIDALAALSSEIERRISAKPISLEDYETLDCPLLRSARKEGIAA